MSIIRVSKSENYAIISKCFLNDTQLSWKAKGILAYLLSKPDNWQVLIIDLINHATDRRDGCIAGLHELEKFGYLQRSQRRDAGKFSGWESVVFETPAQLDAAPQPDFPDTANPDPEKPYPENPMLVNNDLNNNDNNKYLLKTLCRFDDFWAVYPLKENKKKALGIWKRKKLDGKADAIIEDIKRRNATHAQWLRGFVPHPTTYLNGERWNDAIKQEIHHASNSRNGEKRIESLVERARRQRDADRAAERAAAG